MSSPTAPPGLPNILGDIVSKVRRVTKSPSQNQITDDQIIQYVNTYYLYDFPMELRLKNTLSNWTFTTVPNQETYPLPTDTILNIEPPLYINGYQSYFTQSQDNFYLLYPRLGLANNIATGNGTVGPYTFQLQNFPVLQNNVVIGAQDNAGNNAVATDTPFSTTLGALSGTFIAPNPALPTPPNVSFINYVTGAVQITFLNPIPAGETIITNIVPYQPSRPVAALFYNDIMYLRPIPDSYYEVTIQAYINPFAVTSSGTNEPAATGFLANTDTAQIKQWWQLIALGAAMKIFEDRFDLENMQRLQPLYDNQLRLVQRRTLVEQASERTSTIYTEQVQYPNGGNFFGQF